MKKMTITVKIKGGTRCSGQILVGTSKGTSRLVNVIRQGGRKAD